MQIVDFLMHRLKYFAIFIKIATNWKSATSASRQRENFMESLHSDGSATYLLIIWVEKNISFAMKLKQKPYPSTVLLKYIMMLYQHIM